MIQLIDKNFSTIAMLIGLAMILATAIVLLVSGKITGDSNVATGIFSEAVTMAGGIVGFSMHKPEANTLTVTAKDTDPK